MTNGCVIYAMRRVAETGMNVKCLLSTNLCGVFLYDLYDYNDFQDSSRFQFYFIYDIHPEDAILMKLHLELRLRVIKLYPNMHQAQR